VCCFICPYTKCRVASIYLELFSHLFIWTQSVIDSKMHQQLSWLWKTWQADIH